MNSSLLHETFFPCWIWIVLFCLYVFLLLFSYNYFLLSSIWFRHFHITLGFSWWSFTFLQFCWYRCTDDFIGFQYDVFNILVSNKVFFYFCGRSSFCASVIEWVIVSYLPCHLFLVYYLVAKRNELELFFIHRRYILLRPNFINHYSFLSSGSFECLLLPFR